MVDARVLFVAGSADCGHVLQVILTKGPSGNRVIDLLCDTSADNTSSPIPGHDLIPSFCLEGESLWGFAHIVKSHRRKGCQALASVHQAAPKVFVVQLGQNVTHICAILPLVDGAVFVLQSLRNPKPIQKNPWDNHMAVQFVASFVQVASPKVAWRRV